MLSDWMWDPDFVTNPYIKVDPDQLSYSLTSVSAGSSPADSYLRQECTFKDPIEERLELLSSLGYGWMDHKVPKVNFDSLIKKVIFNGPATIVIWSDGTKTVVKCMDMDAYDREKGLMMAIMEKLLGGTKGDVKRFFKKHIPENDEEAYGINEVMADILSGLFANHKEESSDE